MTTSGKYGAGLYRFFMNCQDEEKLIIIENLIISESRL